MYLVATLLLLLSTLLASHIGFLALIALMLYFFDQRFSWQRGATAGSLLWIGHLYWLYSFFHNELGATPAGATLLYVLLMSYFCTGTCIVWWAAWRLLFFARIVPRMRFFCCGLLFFMWAGWVSTPFMNMCGGYPFLNPLLPLFAWVSRSCSLSLEPLQWTKCAAMGCDYWFCYMPPQKVFPHSHKNKHAQDLYKNLFGVPPLEPHESGFIVSPESTYPYELDCNKADEQEIFALWRAALFVNSAWIFGGTGKKGGDLYQMLFVVDKGPIRQPYEKTNHVDFFETSSRETLKSLIGAHFLKNNGGLLNGSGGGEHAFFEQWRPLLCSDFFNVQKKGGRVLLLVNETWIPAWIAALWQGALMERALWYNEEYLWVGWRECRFISPQFSVTMPFIKRKEFS